MYGTLLPTPTPHWQSIWQSKTASLPTTAKPKLAVQNPGNSTRNVPHCQVLPTTANPASGTTATTATPLEGVASGSHLAVAPRKDPT